MENKSTSNEKELLREVEKLSSQLIEAESQRSHFLSHVLNEINNPLTSILGLTKSIMHAAYENPELVHKQACLAYEEAFELDFQMRNIFAAAKIEAGKISVRPTAINFNKMVDNLLADMQFKLNRKKLVVSRITEAHDGNFIYTDSALIYSILTNLVGNAIEYSYESGTITIETILSSNRLFFSIQDEGPGISEKDQHVIFRRFKQLDSGIHKLHRGTGLGLSIAKEYAELLQGELKLKSSVGTGCTFILLVPLSPQQTPSEQYVEFGEEELF
ncbi:MAG: sensor histidine kinase [Chryseotalea sp.]|jgi:signal transduction histidine kinase